MEWSLVHSCTTDASCMYTAPIAAAVVLVLVLLLWLVCVLIAFRQRRLYNSTRSCLGSFSSPLVGTWTIYNWKIKRMVHIIYFVGHSPLLGCLCRAARLYTRTLYTRRLETFFLMSISQSDSPNSHRMTNGATNKFNSTVKERRRGSR